MDCHIVVSPIIFSDFNKFLLRILFLIKPVTTTYFFLAHLSRRLIGELLVYKGIRRPSVVCPSIRPSVNIFKRHLL